MDDCLLAGERLRLPLHGLGEPVHEAVQVGYLPLQVLHPHKVKAIFTLIEARGGVDGLKAAKQVHFLFSGQLYLSS